MVINNVLSYIQCSVLSDTSNDLARIAEYFYKYDDVRKAKETIYEVIGEFPTNRKTVKGKDKKLAEIEDII